MARCNLWVPGHFGDSNLIVTNVRHALMYRLVYREYCGVLPDTNITEALARFSGLYRSGCQCALCSPHYSEIATVASMDYADSLFHISNSWSEDSIDVTDSYQQESLILDSSINDTSNQSFSCVQEVELHREPDYPLPVPLLQLSFPELGDSQWDSDCEHNSLPRDDHLMLQPSVTDNSKFDDYDSQLFSDSEVNIVPPSLETSDPSFSDAETQWPPVSIGFQPIELVGPSCSDSETQQPHVSQEVLHFPHFNSIRNREEIISSDSDCSSHSVSILKRRK